MKLIIRKIIGSILILSACSLSTEEKIVFTKIVYQDGSSTPTNVEVVVDRDASHVRILEVSGIWDLGNKNDSIDKSSCSIFDDKHWKCTDLHTISPNLLSEHVWEARDNVLTHKQRMIDSNSANEVAFVLYMK
jgi:hypothetical protein